jgi:hypothetical protein
VGHVWIDFDGGGRRIVLKTAPIIELNLDWCRTHFGLDAMIQPDGTLWLDEGGEYRYQHLRNLDGRFAAYERI